MTTVRRQHTSRDFRLPKQTILTVSLLSAFAAMTPSADAQSVTTISTITVSRSNSATIGGYNNKSTINTLTNTSVGVIRGSNTGILNNIQIGTLNNQGVISATNSGIANAGTITSLRNSKTITGGIFGIDNSGLATTLTNTSTGTIHGDVTAIFNSGQMDTLTNQGIISGNAIGMSNSGLIASVNNSNSITGGTFAIENGDDGVITRLVNTATGSIYGSIAGVINSGGINTLTNQGTIGASDSGISNSGIIGIVRNSNMITGRYAIANDGIITNLTNTANGDILGSGDGTNVGVFNSNEIDTLTNQGLISAAATGISNSGTIGSINSSGTIISNIDAIHNHEGGVIATLTNTSSGSIQGTSAGIFNESQIRTLTNQGAISGNQQGLSNAGTIGNINNSGTITGGADAIANDAGVITYLLNAGTGTIQGKTAGILNSAQIGTLSNKGVISASDKGISNSGVIGNISNSGTITGGNFALFNDAGGALSQISNSGLIAGNIENDSPNDLVIKGGTDTIFGTLTGYGNTTGAITNTASNVVFNGGNILLNDNINVGSTSYAVNNTGALLQINNPVTISGNYTQSAPATLLIGIADGAVTNGRPSVDSGYGRLVVSGSAVIDSGSHITLQKLNSYAFAPGQRFVVVDAALAGTNYNADTLIYGIDGVSTTLLKGTVVNTATNSDLVVHVLGVSNVTATTRNAMALLNGLASYSGINDEGLLNLFDAAQALNSGTAEEANKAGAQLSPVAQTQSIRVAALPTFDTLNAIGTRVDALRLAQVAGIGSSGVTSGEHAAQTGVWGQAFGGYARQNERDEINGYTAKYAGLLLGVDKALNDQWRAGGAFSYSNTAMYSTGNTKGDATHIDNYGFFGYAGFTAPRWYANLSAGVASQHYNENRAIDFTGYSGTANGSFGGTQWVARGELGYPLAIGSATLTPLASLTYAYLHQNGYTESSAEGAALRVGPAHAISVKTDIGAKIDRAFSTRYGVLVPSLQLAWRHEYTHSKTTVDASFAADPIGETAFSTQGARPVSDSGLLTAGVTVLRANNLSVTAHYQVQAASGFLSQAGTLRLRQLF